MLRLTRRRRRRPERRQYSGLAVVVVAALVSGFMLVRGPALPAPQYDFFATREPASPLPIERLERDAAARTYANSFVAANGMRVVITSRPEAPALLAPDPPRERPDRFSLRERQAR
jgi:hypothetical protein